MALKKCSECDAVVSSKARSCPQCGAPIKQSTFGCVLGCLVLLIVFVPFAGIVSLVDDSPRRPENRVPKRDKASTTQPAQADTPGEPQPVSTDQAPEADTPSDPQPVPSTVPDRGNTPHAPLEPDWDVRKSHWRERLAGSFSPPKPGASGKIRLANGDVQRGKVVELSDEMVKIRIEDRVTVGYRRDQLAATSRAVFFESDFVEHNADLKVNEEKAQYRRELAQFQLEQRLRAERDAEAARRARIQHMRDSSDLILGDWQWRHEDDYAIVSGEVTNISGRKLQNIEVVLSFYAAGGQFITSDTALVEYNPILPDQTTPFTAYTTWNPAMSKVSITFKTLYGGTVPYVSKKDLAELGDLP